MSPDTKIRVASCLVFTSIASTALSFIAVYIAYRTSPSQCKYIDSNSVTIGILTIIVTILIGWQIYQVIDIKGKVDDFHEYADNEVRDAKREIQKIVKVASLYNTAQSHYFQRNYPRGNEAMFNVIGLAISYNIQDSEFIDVAIEALLRHNIYINHDLSQKYIDMIYGIKTEKSRELYNYLVTKYSTTNSTKL